MGFIPAAVLRGTSHGEQFVMLFWAGQRHVSKKAQSVYFLNMHGRARPSHTGLERSEHHGSEVGPKNGKKLFFKTGLPEVPGG